MSVFSLTIGLGLFVIGIIAIAWASFTCVKEIFLCINSDDNDDDDAVEDDNGVE